MLLSPREERILTLLLNSSSPVPLSVLIEELNVSRRTIYRELKLLEASLENYDVNLVNERQVGYRLQASSAQLQKLAQLLHQTPAYILFDNEQRQRALAAQLLLSARPQSMTQLAQNLTVSVATIQSDCQQLRLLLRQSHLELKEQSNQELVIEGSELTRRQLAGDLIASALDEYYFFQEDHFPPEQAYWLSLLSADYLQFARETILNQEVIWIEQASDYQLQLLIVSWTVSLMRIADGHRLKQSPSVDGIRTESLQLAHQLAAQVEPVLEQSVQISERHLLALQLEGVNTLQTPTIFKDSFDVELAYQVRSFIQQVDQLNGSLFHRDQQLFDDLFLHLQAAINRPISLQVQSSNPLMLSMIQRYPQLFATIEEAFVTSFDRDDFSADELVYLLIHFATSLERHPQSQDISLVVICASGLAAAQMLESRLRKYLREVEKIDIVRISELNTVDFEAYDFILSTIHLPHFDYRYQMISPLLLDDEIQTIQAQLSDYQTAATVTNETLTTLKEPSSTFEQLTQEVAIAQHLLTHFDLQSLTSQDTLELTLLKLLESLSPDLISDPINVQQSLVQRYLQAPIGIPDSNFAIFHSANAWVKQPVVRLYELDQPFWLMGMDRTSIELRRLLLLLAPDPLPAVQQQLLGAISRSVIENDLYTEIYNTGSKAMIEQLLKNLFVNQIRHEK